MVAIGIWHACMVEVHRWLPCIGACMHACMHGGRPRHWFTLGWAYLGTSLAAGPGRSLGRGRWGSAGRQADAGTANWQLGTYLRCLAACKQLASEARGASERHADAAQMIPVNYLHLFGPYGLILHTLPTYTPSEARCTGMLSWLLQCIHDATTARSMPAWLIITDYLLTITHY